MIRREINEIKKLYTLKNSSVTRICGCYVDGEKNIKDKWTSNFLSMDEEDMLKYLEVFKKCFAGGIGKNLINIPVENEELQRMYMTIRDTKLKNEDVMDAFYERVIKTYEHVGNYLILVIHDVYDIPGKTSDGIEMEDASEDVYEYILACICSVNLQKPGLGYDSEKSIFTHIERDWILSQPEIGILYPAFNDRQGDRDAALLYVRKLEEESKEFVAHMMDYSINLNASEEKEVFEDILQETLGAADLEEVKEINENLLQLAAVHREDQEPYRVSREEMAEILHKSSISEDKKNRFDAAIGEYAETGFYIDNIVNRRSFNIDTETCNIRTKPEYAQGIAIREIDGKRCIVIDIVGDVTANGICIEPGEA